MGRLQNKGNQIFKLWGRVERENCGTDFQNIEFLYDRDFFLQGMLFQDYNITKHRQWEDE